MEPDLAKKWVRRTWCDEEKRSICLQTLAPGVSVAQVALRYAMSANLIFNWLKDRARLCRYGSSVAVYYTGACRAALSASNIGSGIVPCTRQA